MSDSDQRTGGQPNETIGPGTVLYTVAGETLTIEANSPEDPLFVARSFLARRASGEAVRVRLYSHQPPSHTVFNEEQRAGEVLDHPNIVKILGRGTFGDDPFTVAEYFSGGSLLAWCRTHDPLCGRELLSVASQLARAIDFAHRQGFVHGNIATKSVWLESGSEGRVALADFAIPTALIDYAFLEQCLSWAAPEFMAPEVLMDYARADRNADIYSFAAVLFKLAAGQHPGAGDKWIEIIMNRIERDAPDIRTVRPAVAEELAVRLAQALNRDPGQRPRSASAVLEGVEESIARL